MDTVVRRSAGKVRAQLALAVEFDKFHRDRKHAILHRSTENWGIVWMALPGDAVERSKGSGAGDLPQRAGGVSPGAIIDHMKHSTHPSFSLIRCLEDKNRSDDLASIGSNRRIRLEQLGKGEKA